MELPQAERDAIRAQLAQVLADPADGRDRFDAEVWLAAQQAPLTRFLGDADDRLDVLAIVWTEAQRHAIDPEFALALIEIESSFDRYAISSAGAQGLMQVMPFWKAELGRRDDNLTDPVVNVRYGMTILAHYLGREAGDPVRALTRYHGNTRDLSYPSKVYAAWNARWRTRAIAEVRELVASCYRARLTTCD
ncbi:MAG TPA: lytic transglycosylase domain-containing protein [Pseudomonadales bacterium]|nr:lytic transglycosylase domain-containing protein [Pseudomonadales bacterium]